MNILETIAFIFFVIISSFLVIWQFLDINVKSAYIVALVGFFSSGLCGCLQFAPTMSLVFMTLFFVDIVLFFKHYYHYSLFVKRVLVELEDKKILYFIVKNTGDNYHINGLVARYENDMPRKIFDSFTKDGKFHDAKACGYMVNSYWRGQIFDFIIKWDDGSKTRYVSSKLKTKLQLDGTVCIPMTDVICIDVSKKKLNDLIAEKELQHPCIDDEI